MLLSIECQCAGEPLTPGLLGCMPVAGRDKYPIFMRKYDSTGALNVIPSGTVIDETYISDKFNETDLSKKWYLFPEIYNLQEPAPEPETETIDNTDFNTGELNYQSWTYEHVGKGANPALLASYDSLKCEELVVIFITNKKQLNGLNDGNGGLIGMSIEQDTLDAQPVRAASGVVQKVMVKFTLSDTVYLGNADYIPSGSIAYSTDFWPSKVPLEVIPTVVSATTTALTFTLHSMFGQVYGKEPIEGFVTADISPDNGTTTGEVYNITDAANEPGTLAESATVPGQYVFTYTTPVTSADEIRTRIFKTGYHMRYFDATTA